MALEKSTCGLESKESGMDIKLNRCTSNTTPLKTIELNYIKKHSFDVFPIEESEVANSIVKIIPTMLESDQHKMDWTIFADKLKALGAIDVFPISPIYKRSIKSSTVSDDRIPSTKRMDNYIVESKLTDTQKELAKYILVKVLSC